jgi:hypothetical protein
MNNAPGAAVAATDQLTSITLPSIPLLRTFSNDAIADILFYTNEARGPSLPTPDSSVRGIPPQQHRTLPAWCQSFRHAALPPSALSRFQWGMEAMLLGCGCGKETD